jgi:hypothetical protein
MTLIDEDVCGLPVNATGNVELSNENGEELVIVKLEPDCGTSKLTMKESLKTGYSLHMEELIHHLYCPADSSEAFTIGLMHNNCYYIHDYRIAPAYSNAGRREDYGGFLFSQKCQEWLMESMQVCCAH